MSGVPANFDAPVTARQSPAWPQLDNRALHGLAGEFVATVAPTTESDPAALLFQFLTAFGNLIGRSAHFTVEASQHYTNLFAVLVGASSKARKGTAWSHVRRVAQAIDPTWTQTRIMSGLSSGEGLIQAVEDETASDRRLLIVQSEFVGALKAMERPANPLSPVLRDAWDLGTLRTLTVKPRVASDCHISMIGHITKPELRAHLSTTDLANGFANRILWVATRRSKLLPEPVEINSVEWNYLVKKLKAAEATGRAVQEMLRDDAARKLWREVYPELSQAYPGMFGAIVSRAEAQTTRLSLLYALLDNSRFIRREHLQAGLAGWRYCEDSARYVFGDSLGDPLADRLRSALREAGTSGLSRTEVHGAAGRNYPAARIDSVLTGFEESGFARMAVEKVENRMIERWFDVCAR